MCVWERSTEKLFKKRNANGDIFRRSTCSSLCALFNWWYESYEYTGQSFENARQARSLKVRGSTRIRPQEGPYGGGPCMGIRGPECCMPKLLKQRGSSLFSFLMPGDSAAVAFSPHRLLDVLATAVYLAFVLDERLQDTRGSGRASCP